VSGGAGHRHLLFVHGESRVHHLRPQCKVLAAVLFVLAVVATPREAVVAYASYAAVLGLVARHAGLTLGFVARRLTIELPFVAFALFLPLLGGGDRVDVLGVALSVDGLWAAWNILVKGTLGVATSVILVATTPVPDILLGLDRLRVPRVLTAVAGFMVRYAEVISGEARRMRIARESRGYDPRWLWQARALAASAGTLFLRSYERGERVYLAMVSRGYAGAMPALEGQAATRTEWITALALPVAGAAIASTAWLLRT